jgi:hypothetical protein
MMLSKIDRSALLANTSWHVQFQNAQQGVRRLIVHLRTFFFLFEVWDLEADSA